MRFANSEVVSSMVPGMGDLAGIGDDIFRKSQIQPRPAYDEDIKLTPRDMERRLLDDVIQQYLREGRGVKGA